MHRPLRTLLLAGAALFAVPASAVPASAANVTLDGIPATKLGNYKITCTDLDNGAAQPCFFSLSQGGQAASTTNPVPVADGSDPASPALANPGVGARGWLASVAASNSAIATATGAQADAAYGGTGNGSLVALSKGQYAILANLYASLGGTGDAASSATGASGTQIALSKAVRDRLNTSLPASVGQKTMASSLGVAIASDQSPLPANLYVGGAANTSSNPAFVQVTNQTSTGSVTAAGTNGTVAQAVQGITGGVPLNIQGGNTTAVKTDGSAVTQPVSSTTLALDASVQAVKTALGSPFQAGGSIANTAFGISGPLPGYASTPTFNLGTLNGAATAALQSAVQSAPGTAATTVLNIQGNGSGVAVPVSGGVTNTPAAGATLSTSQPTVGTSSAQLSASGAYNHREIYNPASATVSIFIGASGVTTSTGWEIPPGSSSGDLSRFSGAIFAVAASSQAVRLISY